MLYAPNDLKFWDQADEMQCALLAILVSNVSSPGQLDYRPLQYWSVQQSEVTPACRVDVSSAKMISSTILVSNLTNCPFAVRSGGHTSWAGGSSIQDGILINLANLNMVSLNSDRTVAKVGAGNNWYDVYKVLDPLGISVVGGREAGVGVGGLLLGGKLVFDLFPIFD
jgi:FAD/FMN-containing dehydrogenase